MQTNLAKFFIHSAGVKLCVVPSIEGFQPDLEIGIRPMNAYHEAEPRVIWAYPLPCHPRRGSENLKGSR